MCTSQFCGNRSDWFKQSLAFDYGLALVKRSPEQSNTHIHTQTHTTHTDTAHTYTQNCSPHTHMSSCRGKCQQWPISWYTLVEHYYPQIVLITIEHRKTNHKYRWRENKMEAWMIYYDMFIVGGLQVLARLAHYWPFVRRIHRRRGVFSYKGSVMQSFGDACVVSLTQPI